MGRLMFVDPGLGGTGISIWDTAEFTAAQADPTIDVPVPVFVHSFSRKDVVAYVAVFLEMLKAHGKIDCVYIENPKYHGTGSTKGQAAASKGDLVKLAELVGVYQGLALAAGASVTLIDVNKWKGQLPKDVVKRRIMKVWPGCTATNHDWDAVGIGLFIMGRINRGTNAP